MSLYSPVSCRTRSGGFTAVDLIASVAIVLILGALLTVVMSLGQPRGRGSRQMLSHSQLRDIQQSLVLFAQSNKKGGNDGYYPGLDSSGNVIPDGPETGYSGDGTQPAARLWIMLDGNLFTPEYIINPADSGATEYVWSPSGDADPAHPLTSTNYSYAMLSLLADGRKIEWKETLNTAAIVLGDRGIGTSKKDLSSVWTETGRGDWRGGVTRNDNSTSFETTAEFEQTKFGNNDANEFDHLFEDETGESDTLLVHRDATTAYNPH